MPVKRVRGNREGVPRVRVGVHRLDAATRRRCGSGSRTRTRPSGRRRSSRWCGATRPAAQLELVTTLGPVVGAHAGPGTVGFFWFDDGDVSRGRVPRLAACPRLCRRGARPEAGRGCRGLRDPRARRASGGLAFRRRAGPPAEARQARAPHDPRPARAPAAPLRAGRAGAADRRPAGEEEAAIAGEVVRVSVRRPRAGLRSSRLASPTGATRSPRSGSTRPGSPRSCSRAHGCACAGS